MSGVVRIYAHRCAFHTYLYVLSQNAGRKTGPGARVPGGASQVTPPGPHPPEPVLCGGVSVGDRWTRPPNAP
jgi:hypothetical protein